MTWKTTISEIQKHGLTQPQIAKICECGQATISDLSNEKTLEPRHSLGQALLDLLARLNANPTTLEVPGGSAEKPLSQLMEEAAKDGLIEVTPPKAVS